MTEVEREEGEIRSEDEEVEIPAQRPEVVPVGRVWTEICEGGQRRPTLAKGACTEKYAAADHRPPKNDKTLNNDEFSDCRRQQGELGKQAC